VHEPPVICKPTSRPAPIDGGKSLNWLALDDTLGRTFRAARRRAFSGTSRLPMTSGSGLPRDFRRVLTDAAGAPPVFHDRRSP